MGTDSSKRRASTRAARTRQSSTGEPYAEARRQAVDKPATVADVPAVPMPAPAAVMLARHLRAAGLHLGRARRLAEDNRAPIAMPRLSDKPEGPLAAAASQAAHGLFDLQRWAERAALASGAVDALPETFSATPEQKRADRALYPGADQWCHTEGKPLPQPGEYPDQAEPDGPRTAVRHLLPGPVPSYRYSAHGQGISVRPAHENIPGTPAAPIWDAHAALNAYACGWMDRAGDSPADLAAAADGLAEVARQLADVADMVRGQISSRIQEGSITGVDPLELHDKVARQLLHDGPTIEATHALRQVLDGARAVLPPAAGASIGRLSRVMDGKTVAQLRNELGSERFLQRHRGKTRPEEWGRYDALLRMVRWCQAAGRDVYSTTDHEHDDPGVFHA